jgi:hypothetical protein
MTKRKAAPGQGNGSRIKQTEADNNFSGKVDASADQRHADLMEKAASVLSHSIFRSRLTSPDVAILESALHILLLDAAQFHRWRGSHYRKDAGFIFQDREAA